MKFPTGFTRGIFIFAIMAMQAMPARAEERPRSHRVLIHPFLSYVIGGVNAEYEYNPPGTLVVLGTTMSIGHTTRQTESATNIYGFGLGAKKFFSRPIRGIHLNCNFEFLQGRTRFLPGYGVDKEYQLSEQMYAFTSLLGYRWAFPSTHLLADIGMGGSWLMVSKQKVDASQFNGYQGLLPMINASIGYSF